MKSILILLFATTVLRAAPVVVELPWQEACDGALIEFVADESKLVSVRATAVHYAIVVEWTVHYMDGAPVTAEYRESERGRISTGENVGAPSGKDTLKRIETFKWQEGRFHITDEALNKELLDILSEVQKHQKEKTQ